MFALLLILTAGPQQPPAVDYNPGSAVAHVGTVSYTPGGSGVDSPTVDRLPIFRREAVAGSEPPGVPSVRAPIGHTHTCANGHTWDHVANPSHTCPVCGLTQIIVDSPSRMVNVGVAPAARPPVFAGGEIGTSAGSTSVRSFAPYNASGAIYGGCANGQCSGPQYQSAPIFGGGLFGRRSR